MYVIVQVGIDRHRKTRALRRLTGWSLEHCIGCLVRLWQLVIEQSPVEGVLNEWTSEDFEDAIGFKPDALLQAGFLSETDSGYSVPDWEDHTGNGVRLLKAAAERRRKSEAKKRGEIDEPHDDRGGERTGGRSPDDRGDDRRSQHDRAKGEERKGTERNRKEPKGGGGGGQGSADTGTDRPTTTDFETGTAEPQEATSEAPSTPDPCIAVYQAWRQGTAHPSTHPELPPQPVWKAIRNALDRENSEDVMHVARQAARDPWLRGEKPDAAYPQGRLTPQRGLIHALSPKRFESYVEDARAHRAAPAPRPSGSRPSWEEPEIDREADSEGLEALRRVKEKLAKQDLTLRVVTGDA